MSDQGLHGSLSLTPTQRLRRDVKEELDCNLGQCPRPAGFGRVDLRNSRIDQEVCVASASGSDACGTGALTHEPLTVDRALTLQEHAGEG